MREHMELFRGKRMDNGEWVEGNLFIIKRYSTDIDHYFILPTGTIYGYEDLLLMAWEVDPDTVGECTGLTDKNGKLIFEGDIISIRFEDDYEPPSSPTVWYSLAKVVWSDNFHGWYAHFEGDGEIALWEYDDCDDVVVTDNIHDNPELLKGGEE